MKNIIFIAPPAAGKGTQSDLLKDKFDYNHISTGDMLRAAIASGSELGKQVGEVIAAGNLVSDEIMIKLIEENLSQMDNKPFILDGFPRTLAQAQSLDIILDKLQKDYLVVYLDVSLELAMQRALGRLTCSCGKTYNLYNDEFKPKVAGICDVCKAKLTQRKDDNEETFKIRFDNFLKNNADIFAYYESKGKLVKKDASLETSILFEEIVKEISNDNVKKQTRN